MSDIHYPYSDIHYPYNEVYYPYCDVYYPYLNAYYPYRTVTREGEEEQPSFSALIIEKPRPLIKYIMFSKKFVNMQ